VTIVADRYRFVTGVDTHSKNHQYAVLDSIGRLVEERSFPTDPGGIARATHWLETVTQGQPQLVSIDGAGLVRPVARRSAHPRGDPCRRSPQDPVSPGG
jgi:hypothetical protein